MEKLAQSFYQRALELRGKPLDAADLQRPALVFAPHPDDDVLAVGGTIALKRQRGVEVGVVYLTDGRRAPSSLTPSRLARRRHREALAALKTLGVVAGQARFLDFEDGQLAQHERAAQGQVAEILDRQAADQLFVPLPWDGHRDHEAAFRIVRAAARSCQRRHQVLAYPVWFWEHWPWSAPCSGNDAVASAFFRHSARAWLRGLRTLDRWTDVGAALEQKRAALACHVSQVVPGEGTGLAGLDGGRFLARFFTGREHFSQRSW
ncbi:MAG: PIG-L family deacetylase [Deltaproteobacteria bacterium]|nr:PIG-L family deacetylase [Deltaproteobacteria bacterium]